MSQKISGKNLQYDTTLPPFLARLRGQAASSDGPDPQLVRNRRHAKPRSGSAEAEDAPLVVDDEGNVVAGMRVGADGAVTETGETEKTKVTGEEGEARYKGKEEEEEEQAERKERERVAGIGAGKKRKVGKVVGADDEDDTVGDKSGKKVERPKMETNKVAQKEGAKDGKAAAPGKTKKKAKKIKLSFGDDDG
jgi:hypothetical protein